MESRKFKFREHDYKTIQGMTDKEAGQFIKGLCCYAFDGVPMETKDVKIASAYAYAKVALDESERNRENGKKGGLITAERFRKKAAVTPPVEDDEDPMEHFLKGIVLSVAEEAERAAKNKAAK